MKQESRIPPSTWSQTTRTWSLLHSVHDHGPLRYGLKIEQNLHPWSSTGQTTKYSLKIFKINYLGARLRGNKLLGSVWTSASHLEQRSSVTSQTEIARQYFFGKRWKPRICPAEFFDFKSRYLENENEFFKNSFETVFRAPKSRDRGQLVSAFQLTFNGVCTLS